MGHGVYFWSYEHNSFGAIELAKLWWDFARSKAEYDSDDDSSCAVLDVRIKKPEDEYLDLTDAALDEQMLRWMYKHCCPTPESAARVIAMFVDMIEQKAMKRFAVIKAKVQSPPRGKGCGWSPHSLVSPASNVYVLRNERHELIERIEIAKETEEQS